MNENQKHINYENLPLRVFIGYSHTDEKLVDQLETLLEENGLSPIRDRHFAFGVGFQDQIRRFIEHAHVFMPVVTEESNHRGWVQQEIGYAMAQNIPVLPIAVGLNPGEWIQSLHAVKLEQPASQISNNDETSTADEDANVSQNISPRKVDYDLTYLQPVLTRRRIELVVRNYRAESHATYACARYQEDRAQMLTAYCDGVEAIQMALSQKNDRTDANDNAVTTRKAESNSLVRQSGALTSFHIPDRPLNDEVWVKRYGGFPKSEFHCHWQREERRALERHAAKYGCRLIIQPKIEFSASDEENQQILSTRIPCLLEFLNDLRRGEMLRLSLSTSQKSTRGLIRKARARRSRRWADNANRTTLECLRPFSPQDRKYYHCGELVLRNRHHGQEGARIQSNDFHTSCSEYARPD